MKALLGLLITGFMWSPSLQINLDKSVLTQMKHQPPYINEVLANERYKTGVEGESVILKCPVDGSGMMLYSWEKDGKQIDSLWTWFRLLQDGRSLKIRKFTVDTIGKYTCKGTNGFGSEEFMFYVHLEGEEKLYENRKSEIGLTSNVENLTLTTGGQIRLTCTVQYEELLTLKWFKKDLNENGDKFRVIESADEHFLIGEGVRKDLDRYQYDLKILAANIKDSGMYLCVAFLPEKNKDIVESSPSKYQTLQSSSLSIQNNFKFQKMNVEVLSLQNKLFTRSVLLTVLAVLIPILFVLLVITVVLIWKTKILNIKLCCKNKTRSEEIKIKVEKENLNSDESKGFLLENQLKQTNKMTIIKGGRPPIGSGVSNVHAGSSINGGVSNVHAGSSINGGVSNVHVGSSINGGVGNLQVTGSKQNKGVSIVLPGSKKNGGVSNLLSGSNITGGVVNLPNTKKGCDI